MRPAMLDHEHTWGHGCALMPHPKGWEGLGGGKGRSRQETQVISVKYEIVIFTESYLSPVVREAAHAIEVS